LFDEDLTSTNLYVRDLRTGEERRVVRRMEMISAIRYSPDGREVIGGVTRGEQSEVVAYSMVDGAERSLAGGEFYDLSPDGREVCYALDRPGRGARIMARARAGTVERVIADLAFFPSDVAWGSDGFLHLRHSTGAWRVPLAGGGAAREAAPPWQMIVPSPVGAWRLALSTVDGGIVYFLIPPGAALADARLQLPAGTRGARWSSDGRAVIYHDQREVRRRWIASGVDERLYAGNGAIYFIDLSPDGETLFVVHNRGSVQRHVITNFDARPPL
jgi:hypothetical protein